MRLGGLAGGIHGPGPPAREGGKQGAGEERSTGRGKRSVQDWLREYDSFIKASPAYSDEARDELSRICVGMCKAAGSVEAAVRAMRARHPGRAGPHLNPTAVKHALDGFMDQAKLDVLIETLTQGAEVRVQEGSFQHRKGVPVPPHQSAVEHEEELWSLIWKDVMQGGAWVLPLHEKGLVKDFEFSPLGRVDKFDHLGRVKPKGRLIHDISHGGMSSVNTRTDTEVVPAMQLPGVEQLVRSVIYWRSKYPRARILLTKRDVDSAFRRVPLRPEGVKYFGATLGAWILIMLVLTFGWTASPPFYALASVAISILHRMFRPANPERDGKEPFESHTYLDDSMAAEPDIGERCRLSAECLERAIEMVLGPGAVSQGKKDEEGEWSVAKIILGLEVNTETERITLPSTKAERLQLVLHDPKWDRGCTEVVLHDVQELVGRMVHFTTVFPPARAFLSGLLKLLADLSRAGTRKDEAICPGLPLATPNLTWNAFWDDIEALRWLVNSVQAWSVPCSSPFAVVLPPAEWESRGAGGRSMVFVGSDSTQWSWCTVNWSLGEYAKGFLTAPERARIRRDTRRRRPEERQGPLRGSKQHRDALFIGVMELASIVYGAMLWGHGWRDRVVVAITDSQNAIRWIRQGRSRNGYAAFLLRLLARLQLQHGFTLWAEYVTSEENAIPDCGSRHWTQDGRIDTRECERWQRLMAAYPGPGLIEVSLSDHERGALEWLSLDHPRVRDISRPWWKDQQPLRQAKHTQPTRMTTPSHALASQASTTPSQAQASHSTPSPANATHSQAKTAVVRPVLPLARAKWRGEQPLPPRGHPYVGGRAAGKRADARRLLEDSRREPGYVERLGQEMADLLMDAWAKRTNAKYEGSKRQYIEFCQATGRSPILAGVNRAEDVQTLCLYVTELAVVQGLKLKTIEGRLAAVSWYHLQEGLPSPTKQAPLLKCLLRAVKRRQGESPPKQPVTPDMLRVARDLVVDGSLRGDTVWAGLVMAFGFLLRASEYLAYDSEGLFEDEYVIRWSEVSFRQGGKPVTPEDEGAMPDEIVIKFRGSKSDQFKAGCVRNLFSSEVEGMCPVAALWHLARRLGPERRHGPVMAVPGEDPIGRNEVADILRRAAVVLGEPTDRLTTHSLRAGGATALYAAGYGEAEITYHGRWASASWLVYVHRTVARSGGVARAMFQQKVSLLRLTADPGGRLGGEKDRRQGRGGEPRSGVTSIPKAGQSNLAPTNRIHPSTQQRRPLSGDVPSRSSTAEPRGAVAVDTSFATPVKGDRKPVVVKQCALQSLFGYGSPS